MAARARKAKRPQPTGLVPSGGAVLSPAQIAAYRAVATKLAKYGPAQKSPAGLAASSKGAHVPANRLKTHCKRGHPFTPENTRIEVRKGWTMRVCRTCRRLAGGYHRPLWVDVDGGRVSITAHDRFYRNGLRRLRRRAARAHPDKPGGTTAKFLRAQALLATFITRQQEWYARVGLTPPQWSSPRKRRAA